jgi:hypothetical protein
MALKNLMRCGPVFVLGLLVLSLALPSAVSAGPVLVIQFTGLDLVYSDGQVCDAVSCDGGAGIAAESDPLTTMTFGYDTDNNGTIDAPVGVLNSPPASLYADVMLPVGPSIPLGDGVMGNTPGVFDLITQAGTPGWGVALDIRTWGVELSNTGGFFFGAGSASVFSQDLPFGLAFDDVPVLWSFSSQVTNLVQAGGNATSFNATGTGEIRAVPEPGILLLLGGALSGLALLRRRRQ